MKVGVLALQGDFREHIKAATECGHLAIEVRRASELSGTRCADSSWWRINNNHSLSTEF